MNFSAVKAGSLEYIVCDAFPAGQVHCFSTRLGGVSQGPLASLNLGIHRGDRPENVLENYRRLGLAVGFAPEDTVFARQTHTDIVAPVTYGDRGCGLFREVPDERDALVTNEPGVALTVFTADCCPVLLYDPVARAIGAAHAGWRGAVAGIAANTVRAMADSYGCDPGNIYAAIGPCIGRCCFETHGDVPDAVVRALGEEGRGAFRAKEDGKYLVDLKEINAIWLRRAGVRHIFVSDDCTACRPDRFWSHRVTHGERGSLANIIMLK